MAQRISRAKQRIKAAGATFELPPADERAERLKVVLHVLYLMFNEGYTSTSGPDLQRADLGDEAVRLTRAVHRLLPDDGEVAGLLALMILTDARRAARTGPAGELIPLAEQDRSRGTTTPSPRGSTSSPARSPAARARPVPGAGGHRRRARRGRRRPTTPTGCRSSPCTTCSPALAPNPMVTLNHAVARAMVLGPEAGPRAAGHARRRRADGRPPPSPRRAGPPARDGRATPRPPAPDTSRPPGARRARPSSATSRPRAVPAEAVRAPTRPVGRAALIRSPGPPGGAC